jgi:hypothetical protein
MFDEKTKQNLEYYVYFLMDPETKRPFYIGKGKDNRVFNHMECALESETENDKYDKIREILNSNKKLEHIIVRHGLKEKVAFEIEASLIDTFDYLKSGITNIAGGQKSIEKGLMTSDEIKRLYNAEKLYQIGAGCILININKKYERGSGEHAIYNATKETWTINKRKLVNLKYVLSEYRGLIVEVFEVDEWYEKERGYTPKSKKFGQTKIGYGFNGRVANHQIRNKYINKSIAHTKKKGAASAIRYNLD